MPVLRKAKRGDIQILVEIERESFSRPHWKANDFLEDHCTVAELEGEIVGFLVSRETFAGDETSPPEREILNLAVRRRFRRMNIASLLLQHELSRPATYFLEVRESNLAAQALYRKFGFVEAGNRSDYYEFPRERAIVMKMKAC